MACGDRFRYLVVTASGLNFENPYDDVPLFSDFEEWKDLARRIGLLAQHAADALGVIEEAATPGSFPLWNAVNDERSRAIDAYDALPSFLSTDVAVDIGAAQQSILHALCALEMANDAIVELGSVPPPVPGAPPSRDNDGIISGAKNAAGIAIGLAVLVGIGVALTRKRRR